MPMTIEEIIERIATIEDEMSIRADPLRDDLADICNNLKEYVYHCEHPSDKVAEKENNVDKQEKPKKKVRMPGFALFCKKMQEHVMEEVIAFVKRKIEHPQSPLVIHLFRELTLQNLKMWNALTHEERGDWRERAKEIEVEVSDDIDN